MRKIALAAGLTTGLWGGAALAGNHVVYVGACVPGTTQFTTIQGAVTGIGTPGTVFICPGTYAEQVVISNKDVSLRGVNTGTNSAVTLVAPAGGMVQNATSVFDGVTTYAAQVVVNGTAGVTLSGLTIDGSNNQVPGCGSGLVGILFQNAAGTILNNSVANEIQGPGLDGCQTGLGIYVQNGDGVARTVSIRNNYVASFQKNGITGNGAGLTATISDNTVIGRGPTTGAANNSIQIGFGGGGSVSGNYVGDDVWAPDTASDPGDAAAGILVYDSPGVTVSKNAVADTQYGIAIEGDNAGNSNGATVSGNHVGATHLFDGIDICGSSTVTAGTNVVLGSDESGIHVDSSCGAPSTGDSVSGNTINGGCAGLLVGSGSTAPAPGSNTIENAGTDELTGSDVCPVAAPMAVATVVRGKAWHHASPAR